MNSIFLKKKKNINYSSSKSFSTTILSKKSLSDLINFSGYRQSAFLLLMVTAISFVTVSNSFNTANSFATAIFSAT